MTPLDLAQRKRQSVAGLGGRDVVIAAAEVAALSQAVIDGQAEIERLSAELAAAKAELEQARPAKNMPSARPSGDK